MAQDSTAVPRSGIAFSGLGVAGIIGLTYEIILDERVNAEAGFGAFGYGGGMTYLIKKPQPKNFIPYTGVKYVYSAIMHDNEKTIWYMPLGVTFYDRYGFFFVSLDLGPGLAHITSPAYDELNSFEPFQPYRKLTVYGTVKCGVRFQVFGNKKRKNRSSLKELFR